MEQKGKIMDRGRPPAISKEHEEELLKKMEERDRAGNSVKREEFSHLVYKMRQKEAHETGRINPISLPILHPDTVRRISKRMHLLLRKKPHVQTVRRQEVTFNCIFY